MGFNSGFKGLNHCWQLFS